MVKNSWSTNWGNDGTIKILRGTNECGIGSYCYTAQCEGTSGTPSDPPVINPSDQEECDLSENYPDLTGTYSLSMNGKFKKN